MRVRIRQCSLLASSCRTKKRTGREPLGLSAPRLLLPFPTPFLSLPCSVPLGSASFCAELEKEERIEKKRSRRRKRKTKKGKSRWKGKRRGPRSLRVSQTREIGNRKRAREEKDRSEEKNREKTGREENSLGRKGEKERGRNGDKEKMTKARGAFDSIGKAAREASFLLPAFSPYYAPYFPLFLCSRAFYTLAHTWGTRTSRQDWTLSKLLFKQLFKSNFYFVSFHFSCFVVLPEIMLLE